MRGKTNQSQQFFLTIRPFLSSIGPNSDKTNAIPLQQAFQKRLFAQILPVVGLLFLAPLAACEPAAVEAPPPPPTVEHSCGEGSGLKASLHGGIKTNLSWSGSDMACESMPRPNNAGIRLRISGEVLGERLAFIIAMPELRPGQHGVESPTNVTVTVEGSGRFFSTPDLDTCWTDVSSQSEIPDAEDEYTLSGALFCIAPLGELNGDAAITIQTFSFSAVTKWTT